VVGMMAMSWRARELLIICGIAASFVYVGTDLLATVLYPGFSFTDQAVSELFAIGAPTSRIVVPLFSLASALLLCFAGGIALSAQGDGAIRLVALMFAASAIDALVLWNFFPMHMRGEGRTFTDTMHLILGANPFVWLAIGLAAAAFKNWFRPLSIAALILAGALGISICSGAGRRSGNPGARACRASIAVRIPGLASSTRRITPQAGKASDHLIRRARASTCSIGLLTTRAVPHSVRSWAEERRSSPTGEDGRGRLPNVRFNPLA
jgi:hypothetical protein